MRRTFFVLIIFMLFLCGNVYAQDVFAPYEFGQNEQVFKQSSYKFDVIDPVALTNIKGANYPGLRGANQMVIYTPEFGIRTNTNEFGTEAIVVGDTVVSLSGADSLIPSDGLVISGHGTAKRWMNDNLTVGSKVSIDKENKTISTYVTSSTFLYSAKEKVNEVQSMMNYYCRCCADYDSKLTEQNLEKAKDYVNKAQKDNENVQKYSSLAMEYANTAMSTVIPYDASELKGVWVRPEYYSRVEIEKVLDALKSAGVNNIFIETYYHGKTIFPSRTMERYGFVKQYEDYQGFDPLRIWINEAHKRGIKVHVWFQTFYIGNKPPEANPNSILAKRPLWANYQKKNANSQRIAYSVSEHNGYFLDPANPEVQNFLYELLCEIVSRYKPDGINLDYIRYPQSVAPNFSDYDMSNWGYTLYARMDFKEIYGVDPIELTQADPLWSYWAYYRCSKVTNFVRKASSLCRANRVLLTAVIFPNRAVALDTKMQDWKTWSVNNIIDGFTPLFLTCDAKTTSNLIEEVIKNKSNNTKIFAGLFVTFMNGSNSDLLKQIHATRKHALNGLIIFDYAHLSEKYLNTLKQSVFKVDNCEYNPQKQVNIFQFKSREK